MTALPRDAEEPDLGARVFLAITISVVVAVPAAVLLWVVLYFSIDVICDLDQMESKVLQYYVWCHGICYALSFLAILLFLPESRLQRGSPGNNDDHSWPDGVLPQKDGHDPKSGDGVSGDAPSAG